MNDGALQPLRTVGAQLAGVARLEKVAIVWDTLSLIQVSISDAEVKKVEEEVRLALRSLDERRKGMVEWWTTEPNFSLL